MNFETEIVNKQLENVKFCTADLDSPCDCPTCEKSRTESLMYARASYRPWVAPDQSCDCGGTLDEYDRCNECDAGHDDCSAQECFQCFERYMAKAEAAYEGER